MNKLDFLKDILDTEFIEENPELIKDLIFELIDSLDRKNEVLKEMDSEIQFYRKMELIRESFKVNK
jgi:hypothetical protein